MFMCMQSFCSRYAGLLDMHTLSIGIVYTSIHLSVLRYRDREGNARVYTICSDAIKFSVRKHCIQTALSRRHSNYTHTEEKHRGCGVSGTMRGAQSGRRRHIIV